MQQTRGRLVDGLEPSERARRRRLASAFHGFEEALDLLVTTLDLASDKGRAEEASFLQLEIAATYYSAARWDECLDALERLKQTSWWASSPFDQLQARVLQGQMAVLRGTRFADTAESLIELIGSINDARARVFSTALICVLLREGGRDAEARTQLRQLVEDLDSSTLLDMSVRPELVRAAVGAGDLHSARFLADGMEVRTPMDQAVVSTVRAVIAEAEDDSAAAVELYRQAEDQWLLFDVLERGLALLGEGRCLFRLDRPEGIERLAAANEVFASLDARALMEEVERLAPDLSSSAG